MTGFVIIEIDVHNQEEYNKYTKLVSRSFTKYSGEIIVGGGQIIPLEGHWKPKRIIIIAFPTVRLAKDWWESKSYQAASIFRHKAATTKMIVVEGKY